MVLVTWLPNSRDANASVVPRSFGRASPTGPAGLDGHFPVPVAGTRPPIPAGRGPLVAVAAEKLGDLCFEGGLHQQLGAEAGDLLQDLWQRPAVSEQLIDVVADTVSRRYSHRHGRGSFLRDLAVLKGNLRPPSHLHRILDATPGRAGTQEGDSTMNNKKREAPTLPELLDRIAQLPHEQAQEILARTRPAPDGPPKESDELPPPPLFTSWEGFLKGTTPAEKRRWCARKAKKANGPRLMSGTPGTTISADDVLGGPAQGTRPVYALWLIGRREQAVQAKWRTGAMGGSRPPDRLPRAPAQPVRWRR